MRENTRWSKASIRIQETDTENRLDDITSKNWYELMLVIYDKCLDRGLKIDERWFSDPEFHHNISTFTGFIPAH